MGVSGSTWLNEEHCTKPFKNHVRQKYYSNTKFTVIGFFNILECLNFVFSIFPMMHVLQLFDTLVVVP